MNNEEKIGEDKMATRNDAKTFGISDDTRLEDFIKFISNTKSHPVDEIYKDSIYNLYVMSDSAVDDVMDQFAKLANASKESLDYYARALSRADKLVNDLEHLVTFVEDAKLHGRDISDYLREGKLPVELKDVPVSEYSSVLVNTLCFRRMIKDRLSMFRVMTENLSKIPKFVMGMSTRTYTCASIQPDEIQSDINGLDKLTFVERRPNPLDDKKEQGSAE